MAPGLAQNHCSYFGVHDQAGTVSLCLSNKENFLAHKTPLPVMIKTNFFLVSTLYLLVTHPQTK